MKKKILVISGTRSEYGLLKPVIEAILREDSLKLQLAITGSHLNRIFGRSIKEIKKDGFQIDARIKLPLQDDTNEGMSKLLGKTIIKFTKNLKKLKPSLVLVLGDRVEIFGAALVAFYMNIPVAQIHAGDRSIGGHLDDSARHSISKLASLHFAATDESAKRLIKMGEEKWRVHNVGAPGLDSILNKNFMEREELFDKLNLDDKKTILVLFHSVTTKVEDSIKGINSIISAVKNLDKQVVFVYPNADAGGRRIIHLIQKYTSKHKHIKTFKNIDHNLFLNLMKHSKLLIGNSSSGIIEAPSFKIPIINVGTRQEGRERSTNVIDVDYNEEEITKAIKKALYDQEFLNRVKKCENPYGDGKTGPRIAKVLASISINKELLQKKITY